MENFVSQVIEYIGSQSWHIAILTFLITIITVLLRKKSAHIRYLLWLIVLVKCFVPPLFKLPLAVFPENNRYVEGVQSMVITPANEYEVGNIDSSFAMRSTRTSATNPSTPIIKDAFKAYAFHSWLILIWIIGFILFLFVSILKAIKTNRFIRQQRKPLTSQLQIDVRKLLTDLNIKSQPKFWLIQSENQPFVWGFMRGAIYLPSSYSRSSSLQHRKNVIAHEINHYCRFDAFLNWLQIMAQAIFWFHPFIWWTNRKLRQEREKCCDEMAISKLKASPKNYGSAILKSLKAQKELNEAIPGLAVAQKIKNIEKRIKTIMEPGKKFYRRPSIVSTVLILLLASVIIPSALALAEQVEGKVKIKQVIFPPVRTGENDIFVKIQNSSQQAHFIGIILHSMSPKIIQHGVSKAKAFFDNIAAEETKWIRLSYKFRGPVKKDTWMRLSFYTLDFQGFHDYFDIRTYPTADEEH